MREVFISGREYDLFGKERKELDAQIRALEFYISGMSDHSADMPCASLNIETGQIEIFGDREDFDPPIRLAAIPNRKVVEGFLHKDGSVTFNPEKKILEPQTKH